MNFGSDISATASSSGHGSEDDTVAIYARQTSLEPDTSMYKYQASGGEVLQIIENVASSIIEIWLPVSDYNGYLSAPDPDTANYPYAIKEFAGKRFDHGSNDMVGFVFNTEDAPGANQLYAVAYFQAQPSTSTRRRRIQQR